MQLKFLTGFHIALLVCAGIAAAGILVALIRGSEMQPVVGAASKRGTRPVQNQDAMTETPLKSSIAP